MAYRLGAAIAGFLLLPSAGILWFANEAATTQATAARASVMEAYRGQLRLARSRIDGHWRAYAARLQSSAEPERRFAQIIADDLAEGVVLLHPNGAVAYPNRTLTVTAEGGAIERELGDIGRLDAGTVRQQRIDGVAALLNDYTVSIPASQRLTLMEGLRKVSPNVWLPTEAALRLSIEVLDSQRPAPAPGVFRETAVRDVWALTSADGRAIALYRTGRLEAMMHDLLHQVAPAGIFFVAYPPQSPADVEAIAAGPWLPGWQLSFQPLDMTPFDDAARRQAIAYGSAGVAVLVGMALVGAAAARTIGRHLHLARLKTDLVAAVSHELRTPIASMRVLIDGLLADGEIDPRKTREYLGLLAAENDRLGRLIENFLTFSRLERGRDQFVFAPVQPSSVVTAAVTAVEDRLPAGADLRVDLQPDLPPLHADADAVVTALVNLLDNAIKYTPAKKRIVLTVSRDPQAWVVFAVEDNGIGIPAREQRRIFRRFYRVNQRLTSETGVGLGLSIVEMIVRAHGGSVAVQSRSDRGSTFSLRLPCPPEGVGA